ncbi:MAG: DUF2059 domain-containing protein [Thalassovita sp.]
MRHLVYGLTLLVLFALPAQAQRRSDIDALFSALQMDRIFEVMREEGLVMGRDLGNEMLPGGSDPYWQHLVERIHDTDNMALVVREAFEDSFQDADITPLLEFFNSETGQQIVTREVDTRHSFLNEGQEDLARAYFLSHPEPFDARLSAIADYIEANGLIENNVVGALNSNYLFFRGLVEGGALELSDEEMLQDVWSQEDLTRADTREWLFAFLLQAYDPLSDEAILAYAEMSRSPEGKALNRALFAGFDEMYGAISLSLGLALAKQLRGETL